MSVKVNYKGEEILSVNTDITKTLKTSGKYCEGDIEVVNTQDGGITPTGSVTLTEENTYDVTDKAQAIVDFSATRADLAEAVTAKGVDTLPTSSFDTIAANIGLIEGGGGGGIANGIEVTEFDSTYHIKSAKAIGEIVPYEIFYNRTSIERFDFTGVKTVGGYAFRQNGNNFVGDGNGNLILEDVEDIGPFAFYGCKGIKTVYAPKFKNGSSESYNQCTALEEMQLGSIGNPVTIDMPAYFFRNGVTQIFDLMIYTEKTTLAEATSFFTHAPWGATNATIVYKNSTTGEVLA